jgi:hypothetical protein
MATLDNIVNMDKDKLKEFIRNLFKSDKVKADLIRDLEYKNDILEYALKMAYCQKVGSDNPIGLDVCDNYKEWRESLTDRYEISWNDY